MNENGGVSNNDAATLALFSGGYGGIGVGGRGNMYPGNSMLAAGAHADGTAVKAAIDCNAARSSDGLARISEQNKEQACNDREARTTDRITNMEFRNGDRLRDIEREMGQNAKDAAQCCCDAKLEACKSTAEIKALIIAENSETRNQIRGDALSAANAELTALKTQIACGCCGNGGGHHPHPCP